MESFAPYHSFSGNISGTGREAMPNVYLPSPLRGARPLASQTFSGNTLRRSMLPGGNQVRSMRSYTTTRGRPMMNATSAFSASAPLHSAHVIQGPRPVRLPNAPRLNHNMTCQDGTCGTMMPPRQNNIGMMRGKWGPQGDQQGYRGGATQIILNHLKRNILKIVNLLGSQPNWSDLSVDGGALWKYSNMIKGNSIWCRVFNRVEVCAERHAHKKPVPYLATLSTTTKIKLDPELAQEIINLLPQVGYCSSDNVLRISMDTLEHNLAVLAIVCGIQQGKLTLFQVKRHGLVEKYLQLTTPGHRRYNPYAKYSLIKFIRLAKKK